MNMSRARARHILVANEQACLLKQQIIDGAAFGDIARSHSTCPSSKQGGDLGEFGPGQMVPEFDTVVFSEAVGETHGPVRTQFGYHLIQINVPLIEARRRPGRVRTWPDGAGVRHRCVQRGYVGGD